MADYKHGTYGNFAESVGAVAAQSGTVAVYVGTAPVNLIRGYANRVNSPVKLLNFADVRQYFGYSQNWDAFTLCEAFKVHFDNSFGNVGPIVAINVLNPDTHRKAEATSVDLTFIKGRATIISDTIILDTLALAEKVEGTDYTVTYDCNKGQVVIGSIGEDITGTIKATYNEVDASAVTADDIIGEVTAAGVYSGLGCVGLIYPELGLIPNLIAAPKWSSTKAVYDAMIVAGTKINGHWEAFIGADIPVLDGNTKVDTIDAAIAWKKANGYVSEIHKPLWPMGQLDSGKPVHASTLYVWAQMLVDASHDGIPMESASNKSVPVVKQYFGAGSTNRGFDQQQANKLNANGIATLVYWGGRWVLWGPHTGAYTHGADMDARAIFDVSIRMMMHVVNSFQRDHALVIDSPMTRAMADTIKNREQEKLDALTAVGAFIGSPKVEFRESDNGIGELVEGNFSWYSQGTTTPPFKSGTLSIAYTTEGFATYFGEV